MDEWFRHWAPDSELQGEYSAVVPWSDSDVGYAAESAWLGHEPIDLRPSDDEIWTPTWTVVGTVAVTGGGVSDRLSAVVVVRRLLSANLDRFWVLFERTEPSMTALGFSAMASARREDWALEAISAACRRVRSLSPTATSPPLDVRVVSLRTKRRTSG